MTVKTVMTAAEGEGAMTAVVVWARVRLAMVAAQAMDVVWMVHPAAEMVVAVEGWTAAGSRRQWGVST
jgi:hypothetical protein